MTLFEPVKIGRYTAKNRIVMAPMTRNRSEVDGVPNDLNVEYYRLRAGVGLIITEGTQPSKVGQAYINTPGLHTAEQVEGWRKVADAVHSEGGLIFAQLMHAGRIAHRLTTGGLQPVSASATTPTGQLMTAQGRVPFEEARALNINEIPDVVQEYVTAAQNAIAAGLDGVEIHGANGYLIHQFLAPSTNLREDEYGGSPQNRARFGVEVVRAVAAAIGADRVGVRISPNTGAQGAIEEPGADSTATYDALLDGVEDLALAYLSVLGNPDAALTAHLKDRWKGAFVMNNGFETITQLEDAQKMADLGMDAIAVGRMLIPNPDLVQRWQDGSELRTPNPDTFYQGGREGYLDF
ncbi:MAG: alkene reductase [Actinomycetaceae bacterium]|nr:alkene reductase [Actinomycetaceae bacterium]